MFFKQCELYFSTDLKAHLQNALEVESAKSDSNRIVFLSMSDDPNIICMVQKSVEHVYEIQLSKVFLHRLAIFAKSRDAVWASAANGPQLLAFDTDHPFDSHVWDYKRDDTHPFALQSGFRDYLSILNGVRSIRGFSDFIERFNSGVKNGFHALNFELDDCLTESEIEVVRNFSLFLVMHEFAHIISPHAMFLQNWPYSTISRRSALAGRFFRYRHKAIEIDADIKGMGIAFMNEFGINPTVSNVQRFFTNLACGFSLFDLDRRNTLDKKSLDGLYPLPEIRFDALLFSMVGWENSLKPLRDAVIYDLVRSGQMLGIFAGPFYLYSGPITSLDKQFTKEVNILESVRGELKNIILQLNQFYSQISQPLPQIGEGWRIDPIGMGETVFKEKFLEEMLGVFDGKYNDKTSDDFVKDIGSELERLQEIGVIRAGDFIAIPSYDQSHELRPEMRVQSEAKS
ncbi:hypothetical protein [Phaeobacter inhibens]|uniref:hypothetical protein n=1 Tax=Phaeobacter inhibens TaxID=221822 RepID=UPI0021A89C9D|nr:hypothetical protein [Phaeobacter inhibens]UWS00463.1 hypothetical protein K4L03_01075 [Phaeobacter inhibens]